MSHHRLLKDFGFQTGNYFYILGADYATIFLRQGNKYINIQLIIDLAVGKDKRKFKHDMAIGKDKKRIKHDMADHITTGTPGFSDLPMVQQGIMKSN